MMFSRSLKIVFIVVMSAAFILLCVDGCEPKTVTVTRTVKEKIDIEKITDSIKRTLKKETRIVYIDTSKHTKEVVYVTKNDSTGTELVNTKMTLESNEATADLDILSFGDIYKIEGVINYPKETRTITETITRTKDNSGQFFYLKTNPFNPIQQIEVGAIKHFKNKIMVIGSIEYNDQLRQVSNNGFVAQIGVGIKF